MEKQKEKKAYWGLTSWEPNGKRVIFSGSHSECWRYLVTQFGSYKLSYIDAELGIKLERIN